MQRERKKNKQIWVSCDNTEFNQPTLKPYWTCENNTLSYCLSEFQLRFLLLATKMTFTDEVVKPTLGTTSTRKERVYNPTIYYKKHSKVLFLSFNGSITSQVSGDFYRAKELQDSH